MWKLIEGNIKEFWRGTIAFGFGSCGFITFQKIIILDYLWTICTIGISGIVGGMATALAADFYKHRISKHIFKNKKDERKPKPGRTNAA